MTPLGEILAETEEDKSYMTYDEARAALKSLEAPPNLLEWFKRDHICVPPIDPNPKVSSEFKNKGGWEGFLAGKDRKS